MEPNGKLIVGALPGCEPRLIRELPSGELLSSYRASGGYAPLADPDRLLDTVAESGLLGRGGAAFPMAVKLRAVRGSGARDPRPVVVANGEEGEPASAKDRWLMRHRPHLVLDGARLAAHVVGADRVCVYVSDPAATRSMQGAVEELEKSGLADLRIEVKSVEPGYVAGEETAAVRAINGGPAKPTDKPPRPFEEGVDRRPTLVSNVETLANLPFLLRHGAGRFRSVGTAKSPGTFLATISGAGTTPGLYEVPHGAPFRELLAVHGVSPREVHGALMGGYFAGVVDRRVLDAALDHETLHGLGTGLGCGAISVLTHRDCPIAVAASVMRYFDRENAGQCGSCFNGIAAMSAVIEALRDGTAENSDLERLARWSVVLRSRGACGTLDGAANLARSLLEEFPDDVARHRDAECETCTATPFSADRPFEVEVMTLV
ncbi:NADH-ubiquinone oxidoreductase-F iron-sulfur binding region domain-containing protein [Streptomyces sp. NPDC002577]